MKYQSFSFKKDIYRSNRGGYSRFLNIYCEHCGEHVLLYQKDGPGPLKRMYLDRIIAPNNLNHKKELLCSSCKRLLAIPGIYQKEQRPALLVLSYVIIKKVSKGFYPPRIKNLSAK